MVISRNALLSGLSSDPKPRGLAVPVMVLLLIRISSTGLSPTFLFAATWIPIRALSFIFFTSITLWLISDWPTL
jgi:hypothetical protein